MNIPSQFELMEDNLQNLKQRMPDLPVSGILLCRLVLHIGREMAARFEQQLKRRWRRVLARLILLLPRRLAAERDHEKRPHQIDEVAPASQPAAYERN